MLARVAVIAVLGIGGCGSSDQPTCEEAVRALAAGVTAVEESKWEAVTFDAFRQDCDSHRWPRGMASCFVRALGDKDDYERCLDRHSTYIFEVLISLEKQHRAAPP